MSTIALEAIAAMIKAGDIGPIHRGEFRREHCPDAGSETLFDFLSNYRMISHGAGHVPAMSVINDRFPHITLPETAAVLDIGGLVHESRVYKTKLNIQTLTDAMVGALESSDPLAELRAVRAKFDEVLKDATPQRDLSFEDCAIDILDDYRAKMILKQGVPWPWKALHNATQGLHPGEFYIIAGRPKSRKTFVALYIAAYLVKVFRLRVLFISPEMMPRQVMLRFMAFIAEVDYAQFKKGELIPHEEEQLFEMISMVHDLMTGLLTPMDGDGGMVYSETDAVGHGRGAFIVSKATGQSISYIESKIKEHRPHVVFVDSFYRLGLAGGVKYDSDWKVLTSVSRMLKDICTDHEVPLIGTHQLNREADEKVGGLANLGYADAIGQDCDMAFRVITAHRKSGDRSALVMLGARETSCEGVIINNEPCSNYTEIEEITPDNRKKIASMLVSEEEAEKIAEAEEAQKSGKKAAPKRDPNQGAPQTFLARQAERAIKKASKNANHGLPSTVAPDPSELRDAEEEEEPQEE